MKSHQTNQILLLPVSIDEKPKLIKKKKDSARPHSLRFCQKHNIFEVIRDIRVFFIIFWRNLRKAKQKLTAVDSTTSGYPILNKSVITLKREQLLSFVAWWNSCLWRMKNYISLPDRVKSSKNKFLIFYSSHCMSAINMALERKDFVLKTFQTFRWFYVPDTVAVIHAQFRFRWFPFRSFWFQGCIKNLKPNCRKYR